jgi:hypothetical protein
VVQADHVRSGNWRAGDAVNGRPEIEVTFDGMAAFWGAHDSQYVATFGSYDLDCTVGHGRTPLDAIVDLLDQVEECVA